MMHSTKQLASHLRQVYFGGNWTVSNVQEHLKEVTYEDALKKVGNLNTIAQLTYHIHYFVDVQLRVFTNGVLEGSDAISFDHPQISSEMDWQNFLKNVWDTAEALAKEIEKLPEAQLGEKYVDKKHGSYYRNLLGLIEHTHYHLGQLVLVKKLLK